MVFQGPSVVRKIKKELKKILNNEGVKSYKEIIGRNHSN
jgi:dihydroorotate dehydrogenase